MEDKIFEHLGMLLSVQNVLGMMMMSPSEPFLDNKLAYC